MQELARQRAQQAPREALRSAVIAHDRELRNSLPLVARGPSGARQHRLATRHASEARPWKRLGANCKARVCATKHQLPALVKWQPWPLPSNPMLVTCCGAGIVDVWKIPLPGRLGSWRVGRYSSRNSPLFTEVRNRSKIVAAVRRLFGTPTAEEGYARDFGSAM